MSRLDREARWRTQMAWPEAQAALEAFVRKEGMKVEERAEGRLTLYQGSQWKMRLLGGWFINPRNIPKRVTVTLTPDDGHVYVLMEMSEAVGIGLLDPLFKERITQGFQQLELALAQHLPQHLPAYE